MVPVLVELERVVRGAGEIALRHFGRAGAERKPDRSLVTESDRAVERYLVEHLSGLVPGARFLGEEGTAGRSAWAGEATWAIDPIDGTAMFVAGIPTWAISVGLVRGGEAELGAVYLPASGELFLGAAPGPLWWNGRAVDRRGEPGELGGRIDEEAWLALPSNLHRRFAIDFPAKVRALGSTAAHLGWVARGAAAGTASMARLWDVAGGIACCRAAGVEVGYLSGAPLDLARLLDGQRTAEPVVAAHPRDIEQVRRSIRYREE